MATTLLNAVTVAGAGTALSCSGASKVIMTVTTPTNFIGEVIFEGSIDAGSTYFPMIGNLPGTKTPVDRITGATLSGKTIEFEVDGFDFIRPNVKSISAGSVTVVAVAKARQTQLAASYATPGQAAPSTVVPMGATDGTNEQALMMQSATAPNLRVALYAAGNASDVVAPADNKTGFSALAVNAVASGFNGATWDRARRAIIYKPISAAAAGANAIWTPAAGKKFRLMGFHLSFSGTTNAKWQDGATDITGLYYGVANTVVNGGLPEANGYLSALADNVLNLNLSAAVAVGGLVWGVEE